MEKVQIKDFLIGENEKLAIMCGPCIIESESHALKAAEELKKIFQKHPVNFIFKSSYDKANRSSISSFRGPGLEKGLKILQKIKKELDLPIITDFHEPKDAKAVAEVCDIIQIPAFLCRQTDLIVEAAKTKSAINVKKGQFLAPWDMGNIVEKILSEKNRRIILTERGVSFGYNNLVSDMRSIPIMKKFGFPVCFDATHSVQLPGGLGSSSGGQREFIPTLTKAAIASGANALFIEAHPEPKLAKSDSATVLSFEELKELLKVIVKLYAVLNE
ncbi:MAG: 3-deoxy-8-phosphooctulonate synthase [Chlamydiae bacterium]|nr:3-deoxy-8-phosphooctulonate synthase [Chlamydiota bacterium]